VRHGAYPTSGRLQGDSPRSGGRTGDERRFSLIGSGLTGDGSARADVIGPPPGELYSETNDNSVAILLTYGTARVLLAGDAEGREEEYMASGPYTGALTGG
jgi:beta-lactamase superfamily II metal-dependent hydrolase